MQRPVFSTKMKKGSFGESLRREREMRGVGLEEIASATRISTRFLEALENEQWDRLPGGVFNRGFVRAIARFLGMDEDALVAEYALVTNDRPEVAVWAEHLVKPRRHVSRTMPWLVGLLLVTMAAGTFFAWRESAPFLAAWRDRWMGPSAKDHSATASAGRPAQPATAPGVGASGSSAAQAATLEPARLELKVGAGKATNVKVLADGKIVFDGRMAANENRQFEAREQFDVTASDSFALVMTLNGQEVPPMAQPGERGSVTLTRKDLKKAPGGQD